MDAVFFSHRDHNGLINVALELGDEQVMNRLCRFASAPVDSFDLVADMPVVVFLGQLCRGTI